MDIDYLKIFFNLVKKECQHRHPLPTRHLPYSVLLNWIADPVLCLSEKVLTLRFSPCRLTLESCGGAVETEHIEVSALIAQVF